MGVIPKSEECERCKQAKAFGKDKSQKKYDEIVNNLDGFSSCFNKEEMAEELRPSFPNLDTMYKASMVNIRDIQVKCVEKLSRIDGNNLSQIEETFEKIVCKNIQSPVSWFVSQDSDQLHFRIETKDSYGDYIYRFTLEKNDINQTARSIDYL